MTVSALRRLLLAVVLLLGLSLPQPAWADGAQLFELHCAGCHLNGGNIIRRGKTLQLAAFQQARRNACVYMNSIAFQGTGFGIFVSNCEIRMTDALMQSLE